METAIRQVFFLSVFVLCYKPFIKPNLLKPYWVGSIGPRSYLYSCTDLGALGPYCHDLGPLYTPVRPSRSVNKRLLHADVLYSDYSLQVLGCMHNKTIIGFGYRMITIIINALVCVIRLNRGLNNSRYHAQRHSFSTLPLVFQAGL